LHRALGGPVGRFRFDVMVLGPSTGPMPDRVGVLGVADLSSCGHLLADGVDHAARVRAGDVVLGARGTDGFVLGVVWLNLVSHVDRFGGSWTRPDGSAGYLNQLLVDPGARGGGVGRDLVRGVRVAGAERQLTEIRALVRPDNPPSVAVFTREGARRIARIFGVRVGRWFRHVSLPAATRR
jgi:ribosomal protein S18 acetylase RimI-like enzyme